MRHIREPEIQIGVRVLRRTGDQPLARVEQVYGRFAGPLYAIDYSYGGLRKDQWKRASLYELRTGYYRLTEAEVAEYLLVFGAEVGEGADIPIGDRVAWIRGRGIS